LEKNNAQKKCSIIVKDGLITITGSCADPIARQHALLQKLSVALDREISFQQCVNPTTRKVEKLVIDTLGQRTSTELKNQRVCNSDEIQISNHTHPESGQHIFSEIDIRTVGGRLNKDIDNCSCVVGTVASKCWCGLILPHFH